MSGYACVALSNPKTPANVGHVLRAAYAYGAAMVLYSGNRYKRTAVDTPCAYLQIPLVHAYDLRGAIPFDCIPVAVELVSSARNLIEFTHPDRAFYVFGAEDATLGHAVLGWCKHVIYVPTSICMNLSACVNVVLYDRLAKRGGK